MMTESTNTVAMGLLPLDYGGPVDRLFEVFPGSALEGSIIDRFEAIARRFGARLAIQDSSVSLSYAELAVLVGRIAAATAQAVADQPGPVAILLPHNVHFPAAMLGALAAGRGYVPLDANNPIERNRLIAGQSGAAAVISAGDLASSVRALFPQHLPVVDIDAIGDIANPKPVARPAPGDLAFVVYTSGSTGRPKGAYHNHRNLLHDVLLQTNTLHLNEEDQVALVYSPAVIAAMREIMLTLLNGAALHILPPNELQSDGLVREVRARGITILRMTPVLLRHITDALGPNQRLDSVRVVGLGSQRVDWSDYDLFRRHFAPAAFLIVGIGATECGGNFAHWFVDERVRASGGRLPIGWILPDSAVTIVGNEGLPVGDGEVGEFVLASRYIALGYWRDPELTAGTFTVDPTDPAARVYKTGDWGRQRPDGLLEFVGRKDEQIKLRGNRIEIGEIESALASCRGVRHAAVVVRRNESGVPQQLAAYCELDSEIKGLLPRQLRAMVGELLPPFMVPTSITILDALPLLSTFKIDREELRRRDQLARERAFATQLSSKGQPHTETQKTLLALWREVLKRQDIGCDDDFFLFGGDSLSALDLILRIEERLEFSLPFNLLMEAPTVRQLEERLETATLGPIDNTIRVHTTGSQRPLFIVGGVHGTCLYLYPVFRSLGPDQPCYGLQAPGMDWTSAGCATLPEMAAHYIGESGAAARTLSPARRQPWRTHGV
jgi:amino acid adenylation domain-containing protein